ncbi:CSG1/SUR1-like protein [Sporothrix eucalyptigena]|uniref:CSG1/SUR1-like protein n=1 Tax=Sporothrix eucalyptigena TaxID=1812306 RepID=A0ABP0CFF7_9PEZI
MPSLWRYVRGMVAPRASSRSPRPESDKLLDGDWGSPLSSSTSSSSASSSSWPDSPSTQPHSHRPSSSNYLYHIARRLRRGTTTLLLIDLLIIVLLLVAFEPLITLLRRNEEFFAPRVVLSGPANIDAWDGAANKPNSIPRILHQTTATEVIPEKWRDSQNSCKKAYKDFEYKLWTDKSARDFLALEYPWFIDIWDNYAFPIQRADAIRYFVLHHYGGIYLDMDTWCNQTFPVHRLESEGSFQHRALFKSTLPTGITNDFMITSARHPAYAAAIAKLPMYNALTHFWARWQPYAVIMISAGPMFLTMVVKDYLMQQPSLPSLTVGVINATELAPYITDLESGTWHQSDAKALMWIGTRPWTWFGMGAIGLVLGLFVVNRLLTWCYGCCVRGARSSSSESPFVKLSKVV